MRTLGATARTVLRILDLGTGAMAVPYEFIRSELEKQGIQAEKTALYHILKRLRNKGEIALVKTTDGGALYTRPANLSRVPGFASILANTPALRARHRAETSDRALALREKKAISKWQNESVPKGAHDHRDPSRPCPRCSDWLPSSRNISNRRVAARKVARKASKGTKTRG